MAIKVSSPLVKRSIVIILLPLFFLTACQGKSPDTPTVINTEDTTSFFPVEDFLLGQLAELEANPINPLLIVKVNKNLPDSSWLRQEVLRENFQPFLFPDLNMDELRRNYEQSRFYDQSLPAITFTYSLKPGANSLQGLENWNVYINPKTQRVFRIFTKREFGDSLILVNWEVNKYANQKSIKVSGDSTIISEKTIQWDLSEPL